MYCVFCCVTRYSITIQTCSLNIISRVGLGDVAVFVQRDFFVQIFKCVVLVHNIAQMFISMSWPTDWMFC